MRATRTAHADPSAMFYRRAGSGGTSRWSFKVTALCAAVLLALPGTGFAATASITDLASPTHPVGQWTASSDVEIEWGVSVRCDPTLIGTLDTADHSSDVVVVDTTAYVADGWSGLQVIDISDPTAPVLLGSYDTPSSAYGIAVEGTTAYVADFSSGLQIIDVSDSAAPVLLGSYDTPDRAYGIAVQGTTAYVGDYLSGLQIIDISDPAAPVLLGSYDTPRIAMRVAIAGTTAYVADSDSGLQIVDVSDPAAPALLGTYDTPSSAYGIAVEGTTAYVADTDSGLQIIDVSDPAAPALLGSYDTPSSAFGIAVEGTTAYVAASYSGLQIIDSDVPEIGYSYEFSADADTVPDDVPEATSGHVSFSGVPDGIWYLHVRPVLNGSALDAQHLEVRADAHGPQLDIAPATTLHSAPLAVTVNSSDSFSGAGPVFATVDGYGPLIVSSGFSLFTEGAHVVDFEAYDLAGNVTTETRTYVIDTLAPSVADDAPAGWQTSDLTITLDATDALTGVGQMDWVVTSPSGSSTAGSAAAHTAPLPVTQEGATTIDYSAIDAVGNRCATETVTVRLDKTAPNTVDDASSEWTSADATVSLVPEDALSGVVRTRYRVGPTASQDYAGPIRVSAEGTTEILYWSVDAAGNVEEPESATVRIDKSAPVVSLSPAASSAVGSATFTVSALDPLSGVASVWCAVDGDPAEDTATVTLDTPGEHTIEYWAIDNVGNESERVTHPVTVTRPSTGYTSIAGTSRYATAIEVSKTAFPDGAPIVVIATGSNWPDALGGSALAAAEGGPILLTKADVLSADVAAEIERLGATEAIVLGGEAAVGRPVFDALVADLGSGNVTRIGGVDRYETAELIAEATVAEFGAAYDGTCFIATGSNYPDALGASPLAAAKGWPLLFSAPAGLGASTLSTLDEIGATKTLVLGGTAVVPDSVMSQLAGRAPERIAGADRYGTARVVAEYGVDHAGLSWDKVALATGEDFPDALAGGVLQGLDGSVMLLTPGAYLHAEPQGALEAGKADIRAVRFLGGYSAVSPAARVQALAALE